MAFSINVLRAQVDSVISADNDELSQLRRERHIKAAVERYSQDRPEELIADLSGDGGKYYVISGLASFTEELSQVIAIEYPAQAVTADHQPQMLEPEDWDDDYRDASARYLYFPNHAPASAETARVRYTAPYLWSASSTDTTAVNQVSHGFSEDDFVYLESGTWVEADEQRIATHQVSAVADADNFTAAALEVALPPQDFFAVANLAAGYVCEAISAKYSRTIDNTITADVVDHAGRSERFAARAGELIELYEKQIGLDDREYSYGLFVDLDPEPAQGGRYLFHGRR